ncbi:MAG: biopolymer transporter ExbD [Spirulina sp. DLM2.Bin59]|nr:MAG: biopolymer transporter ExbD [Spirulina sp. DLM2.Bin59]
MTPSTPTKPRKRAPTPATHPLTLWQDTHKQEEVRIEIIPLIDVIFCILTFFILAAVGVSRQQAISLNLPKASTGSAQMQDMLIISLDDFGQVYVEQSPVSTRNQLSQAVTNYMRTRPDGLMVLYASREARYDEVIQVLDILREVGGDRIALATLPSGQDPQDLQPNPLDPGQMTPLEPNPLEPGLDPLVPYGVPTLPELEPLDELETPSGPGVDLPLDP